MDKNLAIAAGAIVVLGGLALAMKKPPTPPPGKGSLYGTVTDYGTGSPVPGVTVNLGGVVVTTNPAGFYQFDNIEPGPYDITFSKDGYQTLTL